MRRSTALAAIAFVCGTAFTACYTSTSNPVALTKPTPTPSGSAKPTPTPTPTLRPTATPTPTPSGPTPTPTATPTGPTPTPTASPTAQPQVVHMGFELGENTDPTFGPVWFYSPTLDNKANVVRVVHGSKLVFLNDGTPTTKHTAGGFGSSGFPATNDNQNQFTQFGNTIDSSLTWSTGILNPGQMSQVFTVGAPGNYFFGCGFHYNGVPTVSNQSMGDVIVSQ